MAKMSVHEAKELLQKIESRYKVTAKASEVFRLYVLDKVRERVQQVIKAGLVSDEAAGDFKIAKYWLDELTPKNYESNLGLFATALKLRAQAWPINDCNKKARLHVERIGNELKTAYAGLVA